MKDIVISAPFGNYLSFADATSTVGTFTRHYRAGWIKRLWRILKTVRYSRRTQSWVNKLGLPNPGAEGFSRENLTGKVVSLHGFNKRDWEELAYLVRANDTVCCVELNLSCPNVGHRPSIAEVESSACLLLRDGCEVIAKLPPVKWMDYAVPLCDMGVRWFHCCNTIPTPGGGMSGKPLMQYSLWAIEELRQKYGDKIVLIGGGGITCNDDVLAYLKAGANRISVASMLFNPFNWRKIKHFARTIKEWRDARTQVSA